MSSEEILTARKLVRQGLYAGDIAKALSWTCTAKTAQSRLKRHSVIVSTGPKKSAHKGDETYLQRV